MQQQRNLLMIRKLVVFLLHLTYVNSCIRLLNGSWQPMPLRERARKADLIVTARILYKTDIPGYDKFYAATFEVLTVMKGYPVLKKLHQVKSVSLVERTNERIVLSAKGFGDSRLCFSNVEVGETYALFLGYREDTKELLAKYDDIFGAADLLYKKTEKEILQSLGWDEWSNWSKCDRFCGTGKQTRQRKCLKEDVEKCAGNYEQKRLCNLYQCTDTINVLPFIIEYQHNSNSYPWKPHDEKFNNQLEIQSIAKAPTHLLLQDEFPKNSVLHLSFLGPVTQTQYIYSIYNSDEHMKLGIRLTPTSVDVLYDYTVRFTDVQRYVKRFPYSFEKVGWHNLALLLKHNAIHININCQTVYKSMLTRGLFDNFDIFGEMYIGADVQSGQQRNVQVEVGQISLVKDENSFSKQCGSLIQDFDVTISPTTTTSEGSGDGDDSPLSGPADDNEEGDVDEDWGSGTSNPTEELNTGTEEIINTGREPQRRLCLNRGILQRDNTCFCRYGYKGEQCELPICKNNCLNGGNCTAPNTCSCQKGTSGSYCQFTECQQPCKNGGMCIGPNQCKCQEGFEGQQCQLQTCSTLCENGGTCTEKTKCRCPEGFKGSRCQHKETCKTYVTKLVSYLKPALVYTYVNVLEPCEENKNKKCKVMRLKQELVNQITYRPEYVCKRVIST